MFHILNFSILKISILLCIFFVLIYKLNCFSYFNFSFFYQYISLLIVLNLYNEVNKICFKLYTVIIKIYQTIKKTLYKKI